MKVLVIGGGGREHAICWKLAKSPKVTELVCAPGNAGIAGVARCVNIGVMDFEKMADFAKKEAFDLVVVGPDDPLAAGLVDVLEEKGLRAGEDISVTGFDNQDLSEYFRPALTTMNLPLKEIGEKASEILLGRLKDGAPEEALTSAVSLSIPCTLVERKSVKRLIP